MPMLVLLNGPPASGKSTLAACLVEQHSLALNLDLDVIRGLLGSWLDQPTEAGLATRAMALQMARVHLLAGHHVVVPQFLARPDFIQQLEELARFVDARFVEVALTVTKEQARQSFTNRGEAPETQAHRDAASLVERSTSVDPIGDMFDSYERLLESRPTAIRLPVSMGDIDATLFDLRQAINFE